MAEGVRDKRILQGIDIARGKGLEIGPLTSPIVAKSQGAISYLDHMSTADLREKYKDEPVVLDQIVDVDYVLKPDGLPATVGNAKFDYIIASHVIEHIPDTVAWFQELWEILEPGGIVSLIIPDKRFTFDINRRVSLPAEVIGAHIDGYKRFSTAMMYDFASNCMVEVGTAEAWSNPDQYISAPRRWSAAKVMDKCRRNAAGKEYVDCHCYVYTPASFIEILRALIEHDMLPFEVSHFMETQHDDIEFYVGLRKVNPSRKGRAKLLASLPTPPVELTTADKRYAEMEALLAHRDKEVAALQQEVADLKGSVSWRMTKGLRSAKSAASRIKNRKAGS